MSDHHPDTAAAEPSPTPPAWSTRAIDEVSWDEIVRTYGDRVYKLAYRLAGNQHDAEDITQETFIRVFRSLDRYRPGSFTGWLHRIATNVFLDMVRRRSRVRMQELGEYAETVVSGEATPEQSYADTNLDPDLQAALDDLAPEFRAAVVLCDVEGLTYEEVGEALDIKVGTVRSRIHRGRRNLREGLQRRRLERAAIEGVGQQV